MGGKILVLRVPRRRSRSRIGRLVLPRAKGTEALPDDRARIESSRVGYPLFAVKFAVTHAAALACRPVKVCRNCSDALMMR
jgi:hypothetical protein